MARRRIVDMDMKARQKRAAAACVFGNILNGEIYDPDESQLIPPEGAWVIITRPLPPIERNLDREITVGRIFWCERVDTDDPLGFNLRDGSYKVRCMSPFGEVCLWPYEYSVLASSYIVTAWQQGAFTFHPSGKSEDQFSDQLFYCLSRGIDRADAMVMCLGTMTGSIGWFEPAPEVRDFVDAFKNVGMCASRA